MTLANCTTLKCLRDAPTEVLLKANYDLITNHSSLDIGKFGPAVDGNYVPDIPIRLLAQGRYHHELKGLISSSMGFEALRQFPTPDSVNNNTFEVLFERFYPLAPEVLKLATYALYPYQGPGVPEWLRTSAFWGDTDMNCNGAWLVRSFQKSYRYVFNVPPAIHGEDVPYTFYAGPNPSIVNDTTAIIHQKFITNYVIHGEPRCAMGACFGKYGLSANALSVNTTEIKVIRDPWASERCNLLVHLMKYN